MENVKIEIAGDTKELVLRTGEALPLREKQRVCLKGTIMAPLEYLGKRIIHMHQEDAHITVSYDKMQIHLVTNETNSLGAEIVGCLEYDRKYLLFGVNGGKYRTPFEMAELIKMNRSCFENRQVAMELVTQLKNFRGKVEREVEKMDDNKGNKRHLFDQVVNSNIPSSFNLKVPIFKGEDAKVFEVEVYFNADDITCTLVSPQANDLVEDMGRAIINEVVIRIADIAPRIVIINV